MRIARVLTAAGPRPCVADGDDWAVIADAFAADLVRTGERVPQRGAHLLAPVVPLVIAGMLHNSGDADRAVPAQAFLKSPRTVVGPGAPIVIDARRGAVKGEAELVAVIGRVCRNVTAEQAPAHLIGWTVANDVTAVEQTLIDETRTQAKNGDGFTPLGPWIETDLDALSAGLVAYVDGVEVARASSADLARNAFQCVAFVSQHLTLGPGDVVLTGAPETAFDLSPGQRAFVEVVGVGVLANPAIALQLPNPSQESHACV